MAQQRGSFLPFGFREMRDTFTAVAFPIALTVMVFFRRRVGLEKLSLGVIIAMTFLLYLFNTLRGVSLLGGVQWGSGLGPLGYYALAFLLVALFQRRQRWAELRRGDWWHTLSHGISYFEFLPIRQDRIYRNIDPGIAFMCGLALKNLGFIGLGLWVMFASLCWRIAEEHIYQLGLKQFFAEGNGLLEGKVRAQIMRRMNEDGQGQSLSMRETGGVPTGIDSELAEVIAARRKEAREEGYAPEKQGVYQ